MKILTENTYSIVVIGLREITQTEGIISNHAVGSHNVKPTL